MSSRITISIVTYNSAWVIAGCLDSIPPDCPVMICDNASKDDTVAVARAARPDAVITVARKNFGFGRGHNVNLRRVQTEFALVFNPDARLLPGALDALLNAADTHKDAAIIGGQHYQQNGETRIICTGNDTYCLPGIAHRTTWPEVPSRVDYIIGAMMLFRMDVLRAVGLFDRKIFMYHEDLEICARVRKAGYYVWFEPLAKVIHLCGKSCAECVFIARLKQFYHSQCKLIVFRKYHASKIKFYGFALKEFLQQLRRFFKSLIKFSWIGVNKHAAGIWGVLKGLKPN